MKQKDKTQKQPIHLSLYLQTQRKYGGTKVINKERTYVNIDQLKEELQIFIEELVKQIERK